MNDEIKRNYEELIDGILADVKSEDLKARLAGLQALVVIGDQLQMKCRELAPMCEDSNRRIRRWALMAASKMRPQASDWLPTLERCATDEDSQIASLAIQCLGQIGRASFPIFSTLLRTGSKHQKQEVCEVLKPLNFCLDDLASELTSLLKNHECVTSVLRILAANGPDAQGWLAQIRPFLEDADSAVRIEAAFTVGRLEPQAEDAIEALSDVLRDPDHRFQAAVVLDWLGPRSSVPLMPLIDALCDPDDGVRWRIGQALAGIEDHKQVVEQLISSLTSHPHPDVRAAIASMLPWALGWVERQTEAIEHLSKCLLDPEPIVVLSAIRELLDLGEPVPDLLSQCANGARSSSAPARRLAAILLKKLVPLPSQGKELLGQLAHDPERCVAEAAAESLETIGSESGE